MRFRSNPCDCAGTAPGFPQHESYCASIAVDSYDEDEGYDRLEDRPDFDFDDPWAEALASGSFDDEPPFE